MIGTVYQEGFIKKMIIGECAYKDLQLWFNIAAVREKWEEKMAHLQNSNSVIISRHKLGLGVGTMCLYKFRHNKQHTFISNTYKVIRW